MVQAVEHEKQALFPLLQVVREFLQVQAATCISLSLLGAEVLAEGKGTEQVSGSSTLSEGAPRRSSMPQDPSHSRKGTEDVTPYS